jgi:hypothetical protein
MQEYAGKIKAFLEEYRHEKYSGGIKMAFEEGKPITFWRSDAPDFKDKPIKAEFDLEKILQKATSNVFSGSLFFIFENGEIKHYYSIETLQGKKLLDRLENSKRRASIPKRVIAIRKQGAAK